MPNYTDQQIEKRVTDGNDAKRRADADKWAAAATQPPHNDDAAALQKLRDMSGVGAQGAGYATADAQNYGRMKLGQLDPSYHPSYDKAKDGGFSLGGFLGGALKHLAPLAAFIPGVGPIAAGAIAAGANTGGSLIQGQGLDLKDSLLKGALSGVGNAAGAGKVFGGGGKSAIDAATHMGPASSLEQVGGVMQSGGEAASPGFLGQLANQFKNPQGTLDFGKLGQVGAAGLGIMEKRAQRNSMERLYKTQANASAAQTSAAESAYAARQPLRDQAMARLGSMQPRSSIFGGG